jgi:hypothetical protein
MLFLLEMFFLNLQIPINTGLFCKVVECFEVLNSKSPALQAAKEVITFRRSRPAVMKILLFKPFVKMENNSIII